MSYDWLEWLVVAGLVIWFTLTVVVQLFYWRLAAWRHRWDVFHVLPIVRLYTKIPREHRLYFRDRDAAGTLGPWQLVPLYLSPRPWRAVFNPEFREADATLSCMELLGGMVTGASPPSPERVAESVAVRGLWRVVVSQPETAELPPGLDRQFSIRRPGPAYGDAEELVYASDFRPLAAEKGAGQ